MGSIHTSRARKEHGDCLARRSHMSTSHQEIHSALTGHRLTTPALRPARFEPLLADARDSAVILDVCLRQFHALRPKLPAPVVLGVRSVRWRVAELRAFVECLPAAPALPEPPQLKAGKAARRGTAGAAQADCDSPSVETQARRGVKRRGAPSNSEPAGKAAV
jgi:hypothetical protein